jgi:hypothetical protein
VNQLNFEEKKKFEYLKKINELERTVMTKLSESRIKSKVNLRMVINIEMA